MSPEDIKKLLGGYATGTLTTEEQQALFAAALEDQELFDALAREQALRDLLRDPAARAELLTALDTPANRLGGFWQWLRRPVVAGLATAGVATIAVVAVWQGTRVAGLKTAAPVIVAELRPQEMPLPARPTPPAGQPDAGKRSKVADAAAPTIADKMADMEAAPVRAIAPPPPGSAATEPLKDRRAETNATAPAVAPPPARQFDAGRLGKVAETPAAVTLEKKAVPAPAPAPPPPPPPAALPALMARKAEAESVAVSAGAISGSVKEMVPLDARALFYANPLAPGTNAFVESSSGGGARPPALPEAPRADAAPRTAKALSGFAAPIAPTAPRLGVRISILRGEREVDLTTVLDPGETVRLKLTPNADGFLYVAEGARVVASGAAQRLKPFETPELRFEGSGQKQLVVTLSRRPQAVAQLSLGALARDNLVETSSDQDRATYVVSGPREPGAQQVVVPVTLTYR